MEKEQCPFRGREWALKRAGAVFRPYGGLGERLGYSGIKLSLETNLCTNKCYLEVYGTFKPCSTWLKTGRNDISIPL
jgi:hypothetical protein